MNQITVIHTDGTTLPLFSQTNVSGATKATQKMALLSDDLLSITVTSAVPLSFELGDIINVYGKGYRLNQLPQVTKTGNRRYSYELQLEGAQYDLLDVSFQLPEGSYGDNLYGDLSGLITALNWNVRRVFGTKWNITTALTDTPHKNLTVTGKNCLQVAQELCSEFGVEFKVTISGSTRTMTFVEKVGSSLALTLKYGQGNGLYQLSRQNVNNAGVTTRLFCYGSGDNLGSGYRHTKLCLPDKTRLTSYIEDAEAVAAYGVREGEKVFSDIRPERIGTITGLVSGDFLSFKDNNMDFDLNEKNGDGNTKYLIPDISAQIKFISGNLGGYTFDLHSYDHGTKTFKINQFTDENGTKFPDTATAARQFNKGDRYIITEINLPSSYIEAAEDKLQTEGSKELAKICHPQVSYKLTLDEAFFIELYGRTDSEVFHPGDSITIVDEQVGVNREVRITRIERDLLRPHSYDITLSDTVTKTTTTKVINDITEINEVIQNNGLADVSKARRRWMATKELQEMVFDPDGYFDPDNIKPLSVETAMLTVAAKSQQFTLVGCLFQPNLAGRCNDFYAQDCRLVHYALLDNVVTFNLTGCTYSAANGNALTTNTAYYIYARCSKVISSTNTGTGVLLLDTAQHKAEETSYYYFLIGVLNSAVDSVRAISLTYGATTINGAFITTGRIQSQDENNWLDLDGGQFRVGDSSTHELSWNKNANGKLILKGGFVQNDGGDEDVIGLYRGVYNGSYTYYHGDEVTYSSGNVTSTYRRIGTGATQGIAPTNTTYWQVLARGTRGSFKARCFKRTNTDISGTTPTGGSYDSPVASGWSDGVPSGTAKLWTTVCTFYSDGTSSGWSAPAPETDTATLDVEFSPSETQPSAPSGSTPYANHESEGWYDPNSANFPSTVIWRAERKVRNGVYDGEWTITRIYGEKGESVNPNILEDTLEWKTGKRTSTNPNGKWFWLNGRNYGTYEGRVARYVYPDGESSSSASYERIAEQLLMDSSTRKLEANTWYTLSVYCKGSGSFTLALLQAGNYIQSKYYFDGEEATASISGNNDLGCAAQLTTNWERHTLTFQMKSSFSTTYPLYASTRLMTLSGYAYIAMFKLEKGKEATAYIPHENDLIGADGQAGASAPYYKYKYQWNGSRTAYPTPFTPSALNAGSDNWKDTQPTKPGTLYYLWRTTGKVSADGNTLVENWSTPIRVTPIESSLKIEVRGTKNNGTTAPAPYVHVYGSDITGSYGRGHNLKVLNASSLSVVWEGYFDTYGDTSNISSLISRINSYQSPAYIIVLYSHDAISINSALNACLHKFGCNHRISLTAQRYAFAFIGRWGLNPGAGITKYSASDEKVDIAATVIEGELITNGSDGINGENLVDNSEAKESYSVSESTSTRKFIQTQMIIPTIPEGKTISCQVRVTLSGCSFPTAGGEVLVYFGSNSSWPTIGYLNGITANGTYDLKTEAVNVNSGDSGWNKYVYIRHYNFYNGGTITIERVKIEEGGVCTEWTPSKNDRRGASTPYQGVYDSSKAYYGNLRRTDVVKYNDVYYVARADAGVFTNKLPTDTDYWNDYGGQFESVATQLLFAEFAYVENLGVRDLQTAESGKRVHISGDENAMTIYDADGQTSAVFSGDQFTDSQLFGGADMQITPTDTNHVMRSGDALHPDMTYNTTQTNSSFTFSYAGVLTGRVVIAANFTNTLVRDTTHVSRIFYVQIAVIVDGTQVGLLNLTDSAGSQTGSDSKTVDFSVGLAAGTHTIKTRVTVSVPYYTSGHLTVTAKSTFTNVKASADVRMARYFANGQAVGCSASQYMEALLESNKMLYKVRAGNCGIRLYDGTLQIMIGGTWYTCSRDSSTGALKLT